MHKSTLQDYSFFLNVTFIRNFLKQMASGSVALTHLQRDILQFKSAQIWACSISTLHDRLQVPQPPTHLTLHLEACRSRLMMV